MRCALLLLLLALPCGAEGESLNQTLQAMARPPVLTGEKVVLDYGSVVPMALERNLNLKSLHFEVPIAEARYDQAVAARNPTFSLNGLYENKSPEVVRSILPDPHFLKVAKKLDFEAANLYLEGQNTMLNRGMWTIPVYTGGRLESAMHVQRALAEATRFGYDRTNQRIAYLARGQYLSTLLSEENLQVAQQVLAQAQETLRYAKARLKAGVGNRYEVMQAEVSVSNAQDVLTQSQNSAAKARADLAGVLNLPLLTDFRLGDPLGSAPLTAAFPSGDLELAPLVLQALSQRPELEGLRQTVIANQEQENQAQAGLLPQLSANISYDLIGNTEKLRAGLSELATLIIPIFDGGVANAQKQEFVLRGLQLGKLQLQLLQDIVLEVRKASLDVAESQARLKAAEAAESRAQEAVRIAALRFQVGAGTSLELVSAQTILANSQFALALARFRQANTRAVLLLALGSRP